MWTAGFGFMRSAPANNITMNTATLMAMIAGVTSERAPSTDMALPKRSCAAWSARNSGVFSCGSIAHRASASSREASHTMM